MTSEQKIFETLATQSDWLDNDLDSLNSYCYLAAVTYPSSLAQYQLDRITLLESCFPTPNQETDRLLRKLDKRYWKYIWQ